MPNRAQANNRFVENGFGLYYRQAYTAGVTCRKELNVHKMLLAALCLCIVMGVSAAAGDLYHVKVANRSDAETLNATAARPVLRVSDGYLVLAEGESTARLSGSGLKTERLAADITPDQLALDNRRDDKNVGLYKLVYQEGRVRLFALGGDKSRTTPDGSSLIPVPENLTIEYTEPLHLNEAAVYRTRGLTDLIDNVSLDTVSAYLYHLQAYNGRLAGTQSNYSARDWLVAKLQSYGYDSVGTMAFWASVNGATKQCYNVYAFKEGTVYPNRQVVVGAHFDAVLGSPGVDDNGTGTTGVLEIARALADVETEKSFVFVLFDSEEQGLNGSYQYAYRAAARGDSIVCMLNMDMIGYIANSHDAGLVYGATDAYAHLWAKLADSLVDITGHMAGTASNSDHYYFTQFGYDVMYPEEYIFSSVYHTPHDSTTYIDFDYCTRVIKASLASVYTVAMAPLPVRNVVVRDGGDGQSLQVNWGGAGASEVDHYVVYYDAEPDEPLDSVLVPTGDTSVLVTGLTQERQYHISVVGVNADGRASVALTEITGIPRVLPAQPQHLAAWPQYHAIKLTWTAANNELDFNHYGIIRDGELLPATVTGGEFVDQDYDLGQAFHDYLVVAVDNSGNLSDTVGTATVSMKIAALQPGRILAVNRSSQASAYMVNEVVTGEFMRDALTGYDYDYYSDTAASSGNDTVSVNLVDMIDYDVVIIGAEAARTDEIGYDPGFGGILDTIGYYLSIGGKVIIFGRWGTITTSGQISDTDYFTPYLFNNGYEDYFHMSYRVKYLSSFSGMTIFSDLIGAHGQTPEYPDLVWDSAATMDHSVPWTGVSGIPCPSFGVLEPGPEVIYTYDSRNNFYLTEGKPIGWRYHGSGGDYVFFEMPLSFMDRPTAKNVLQTAVGELLSPGSAAVTISDPDSVDMNEELPSTINLYFGDFADGNTAEDIYPASVKINGTMTPLSVTVLPSHPSFTGSVLQVTVAADEFVNGYGSIIDTVDKIYTASWQCAGEQSTVYMYGRITLIGLDFIPGDANGDSAVDIGDPVFLINYIFKSGPAPDPLDIGDTNCDGVIDVGDVVHLINFIFKSGPPPGC